MIYFDNNATTKPDERVVAAVNAALASGWGNPSSHYELGGAARRIVEDARAELARLVGASGPGAVIFTSGGTESINTAIHAAMRAHPGRRRLLSSTVEHSAVLRTLDRLPRQGREVVHVGVDGAGALDAAAAVAALDERTALVSLQLANNETGVLLDPDGLHSIVGRARACGAWVHLDAVQAVGKVPVDFQSLGVDLLSVSAHKFHGPKGVGALVVRPGIRIEALLSGGPQEDERRAGTENVPGIAGLGAAAAAARGHVADAGARQRLAALRARLERGVLAAVAGSEVNGGAQPRLPNTTNVYVPGVHAEALQALLDAEGLAVSTGSACNSSRQAPSHVLLAMGMSEERAGSSIRLSLSRLSTTDEVEAALEILPRAVEGLRALAP